MSTTPAVIEAGAQALAAATPPATSGGAVAITTERGFIATSPLDLPVEQFKAGLERRKENRLAMMAWIKDALIEGSDYGKIHVVGKDKCPYGRNCRNPQHFSKPSLFKPGAEKICGMLGVSVRYPALQDYEKAALEGRRIETVIIRCEIRDAGGRAIADGIGGRLVKKDYGDINKSLKMAEKSAHIDAVLRLAGLSEVFTQDIEDMVQSDNNDNSTGSVGPSAAPAVPQQPSSSGNAPQQSTNSAPRSERGARSLQQAAPAPNRAKPENSPQQAVTPAFGGERGEWSTRTQGGPPALISEAQHRRLEALLDEAGIPRERVKNWLSARHPDLYGEECHLNKLWVEHAKDIEQRIPHFKQVLKAEKDHEKAAAEREALELREALGWATALHDWNGSIEQLEDIETEAAELAHGAHMYAQTKEGRLDPVEIAKAELLSTRAEALRRHLAKLKSEAGQ